MVRRQQLGVSPDRSLKVLAHATGSPLEYRIISAVNGLRCLTTRGCFPNVPCASGRKPTKLQLEKNWEEHSFCAHDFLPEKKKTPCIVYLFGLFDSIDWEAWTANKFGCQVFAFDPTFEFNSNPAPGVSFYKLGLQGA
jgi:hypothetical protein